MSEQIGIMLTHPRRWTWWRYHEQVQKRRKEGGIHGFPEADVQATYEHMAAADMADDYEAALAELRAEAQRLQDEYESLRLENTDLKAKDLVPVVAEQDAKIAELRAERDEMKENYLGACQLVAEMHAAAVGEVTGPRRGVVEDVADVRTEITELRAKLEDLHDKYVGAQEELHELRIKTKWEPVEDGFIHDGLVVLELNGDKFRAVIDNDDCFMFYFKPDVRLCRRRTSSTND